MFNRMVWESLECLMFRAIYTKLYESYVNSFFLDCFQSMFISKVVTIQQFASGLCIVLCGVCMFFLHMVHLCSCLHCDRLGTCPGCTLPSFAVSWDQCQPPRWREGWMDILRLLTLASLQRRQSTPSVASKNLWSSETSTIQFARFQWRDSDDNLMFTYISFFPATLIL